MIEEAAALGVLIALLGLVITGFTLAALRFLPHAGPLTRVSTGPSVTLDLSEHDEAILLVEAGGSVTFMNQQARLWFDLGEDEPDLERLARRVSPSDAFLALCARQGRARLALDGRFADGTSYSIPYGSDYAMLVSLRQPPVVLSDQSKPISESGNLFAEIGLSIVKNLDLNQTLIAILECVERLVPADLITVGVWQSGGNSLQIYRLSGLIGQERMLESDTGCSEELASLLEQVIAAGGPVLVEGAPGEQRRDFSTFLGAPLRFNEEPLGVLLLSSTAPGSFTRNEIDILRILSPMAATALHNSLLYEDTQRKTQELSGLRQVTLAAGEVDVSDELFSRLIESISPILEVEILGFFILNEPLRRLEAQTPFIGIPESMIEWARVEVLPESQAEALLNAQELIITSDSPNDPCFEALGLHHLAQAAGMKAGVLVPLSANGKSLGFLLAANKADKSSFGLYDQRMLKTIAGETARVIEDHRTLVDLRDRLNRAEGGLREAQEEAETARDQVLALLDKDRGKSLAIQSLNRRRSWIEASLQISGLLYRQPDVESVLTLLSRELLARLGLDTAIIVAWDENGPRLVSIQGVIPEGVQVEALLGQRSPLLSSCQTGRVILSSHLQAEREWFGSPLLNALEADGMICLPIGTSDGDSATGRYGTGYSHTRRSNIGQPREAPPEGTFLPGRVAYSLLAVSRKPLPSLDEQDVVLFNLLAQQASTALQVLEQRDKTIRRMEEVRLLLDFTRLLSSVNPFHWGPNGETGSEKSFQLLAESALHLIPAAQSCVVLVWDAAQELLVPRAAAGYQENERILKVNHQPGETPAGDAFLRGEPVQIDEVEFARQYNLSGEDLLHYSEATGKKLPLSNLAVPIRSPRGIGEYSAYPMGVLLLDNYENPAAFTSDDLALITSLAQQTALTLENARLYRASEQRAAQLQALARASVVLTATLEPETLARELLNQLNQVMQFDTGTLWLRQGNLMVVRAAIGFADDDERIGLSVAVEDSLLMNEMAQTGQPIIVGDVRQDARFPTLVEQPYLSWLGVPLIAGREVIGVIALEKAEANFYSAEQALLAATYSGQAAVAVENAGLYAESLAHARELDQRSHRLALLNQLASELSATLDTNCILESTLTNLQKLFDCLGAAALLFDATGRANVQVESLPAMLQTMVEDKPLLLPHAPLFDRIKETLGIYQTEDVTEDPEFSPLVEYLSSRKTRSLLVLPLATGNDLHGLLLVFSECLRRFTPDEVDLARTIANQAAVAVQNARLYAETRLLSADLERRVKERTAELRREHQRTQTLLKVLTELSSSLDLEHVLNRTLKVLNEMVDADHISVLIIRPGEHKLYHLASLGYTDFPPIASRTAELDPDESLAGWVIANRQPALIADIHEDPRWAPVAIPQDTTQADWIWARRSAIGVPLMIGAEVLGALLFFHPEPGHFSTDQVDMVEAVGRQVAVAVNNAELYRLIRDQAEDLGGMLRRQQVETSRTRAILEAVADGVLVTDAERKVTLFNASAERILSLDRSQVIGRSLEDFLGLFGRAARTWVETIHAWSQDASSFHPGDVYAEQITLEDGRVVSVHLAPVLARSGSSGDARGSRGEFLGTVSIFRDITHQVEVDRLKSEFVATVSHELRTPMTSIKGYVEVLLMGAAGPVDEQQRHFLEIVKANTERLSVLVNDLLDISQIESGRVALSMASVDMQELVEERVTELRRLAKNSSRQLDVELQVDRGLPPVCGDAGRVRQILDNLLENAYLYTPEGGRITVRLVHAGEELRVEVQDTGIGIPLDLQERVFERFYRGEHPFVLASSGTGLGLAIVRNLVEMHGGRIWLESSGKPGEGSKFSFTLPFLNARG